jgi:hypothetical protein
MFILALAPPALYQMGTGDSFSEAWSWLLISIYHQGKECMELYLHSTKNFTL